MTFMCTKYPHLREQIQFYKSGKKWDDMINEIFNKLNTSTTVTETLTRGTQIVSEMYIGTPMGYNPTSRTSKRQRGDDEYEGPVSDAEFREDVLYSCVRNYHQRGIHSGEYSVLTSRS